MDLRPMLLALNRGEHNNAHSCVWHSYLCGHFVFRVCTPNICRLPRKSRLGRSKSCCLFAHIYISHRWAKLVCSHTFQRQSWRHTDCEVSHARKGNTTVTDLDVWLPRQQTAGSAAINLVTRRRKYVPFQKEKAGKARG